MHVHGAGARRCPVPGSVGRLYSLAVRPNFETPNARSGGCTRVQFLPIPTPLLPPENSSRTATRTQAARFPLAASSALSLSCPSNMRTPRKTKPDVGLNMRGLERTPEAAYEVSSSSIKSRTPREAAVSTRGAARALADISARIARASSRASRPLYVRRSSHPARTRWVARRLAATSPASCAVTSTAAVARAW